MTLKFSNPTTSISFRGVHIGAQGFGLISPSFHLDLAHRRKAREGRAAVADAQLLFGQGRHARRIDFLFEREALPRLGAQRNDGGDQRQHQNNQHDHRTGHGAEIAECEVDRTAVADQRQNRADRHARQQDQLRHQKEQAEKDEEYNIEHRHREVVEYWTKDRN